MSEWHPLLAPCRVRELGPPCFAGIDWSLGATTPCRRLSHWTQEEAGLREGVSLAPHLPSIPNNSLNLPLTCPCACSVCAPVSSGGSSSVSCWRSWGAGSIAGPEVGPQPVRWQWCWALAGPCLAAQVFSTALFCSWASPKAVSSGTFHSSVVDEPTIVEFYHRQTCSVSTPPG